MQLTEIDIGNDCKSLPKWLDTCTASVIDALCNQPTCGTPTQLFDACRTAEPPVLLAESHRFRDGEPILLDVNRIGSVSSVPQGGLAASPVATETVDQIAMRNTIYRTVLTYLQSRATPQSELHLRSNVRG